MYNRLKGVKFTFYFALVERVGIRGKVATWALYWII